MGLTQREVKERQAQVWSMTLPHQPVPVSWQIIKRNVFYTFNALNFAIALALALCRLGAIWSSLLLSALTLFSGIVTELRAKHMVDKLNLMTKGKGQNHS